MLQKFNISLAIITLASLAYKLVFDSNFNLAFYLVPIMFLSIGMEYVKGNRKGLGYFYLIAFSLVCLTAIFRLQ